MVEIQKKFTYMHIKMVFQKKLAKLILLKILLNSAAQIFKNVKIVLGLVLMQNVGHKRNILHGK